MTCYYLPGHRSLQARFGQARRYSHPDRSEQPKLGQNLDVLFHSLQPERQATTGRDRLETGPVRAGQHAMNHARQTGERSAAASRSHLRAAIEAYQ